MTISGLDSLLALFKKKQAVATGHVSVMIAADGVSYVATTNPSEEPLQCSAYGFFPCAGIEQLPECLSHVVSEGKLAGMSCNWVLHPSLYRILVLDAPQVSEAEYQSAVRWQIKEMVDFSLEEAIVDVFFPPKDIMKHYKKVNVVVVQQPLLVKMLGMLRAVQLTPTVVDIHEFALRNLLLAGAAKNSELGVPDKSIAMLHILPERCIFLIVQGEDVYFVRYLNSGGQDIDDPHRFNGLVGEIKKSCDYYRQQLRQSRPEKIILSPTPAATEAEHKALCARLNEALEMETLILDLNEIVSFKGQMPTELFGRCYIAVGGILRKE